MTAEVDNNLARGAVAAATREHFGRLLAILIRDLGNFQLAEDALQDALESAILHWSRSGVPRSLPAWLLQASRRKAIDRLRRVKNFDSKAAEYGRLMELDQDSVAADEPSAFPDERLRLIFTCCHPALDAKTRIALSLRTLCGLTTAEIARAFVDSEEAMSQRLTRARHKIARAGIPYAVPAPPEWPERLQSVLAVVYLIFNEGHTATSGPVQLRIDLCEEAIRLARILSELRPAEAEITGLHALLLLTHARRHARANLDGDLIPLDEQDRTLWDQEMINHGLGLLDAALQHGKPGPYQIQAAVAAVHAEAAAHQDTRWPEIVALYGALHRLAPNPVYLLNQAVALSFAEGAEAGLIAVEGLETTLAAYQPFHAARADILRRLGHTMEARTAYEIAIALGRNRSERTFLERRLANLAH